MNNSETAREIGKVNSLTETAIAVQKEKDAGKSLVHCHGVFDLLHPGHVRHLETAKKEGDILVVTVTADRFVNKGPGRPVFNHDLRAESLAALECVNYVAVNHSPTAIEPIQKLQPDVYVKGSEYSTRKQDENQSFPLEEKAVRDGGGRVVFTDDITFSSSNLINSHFSGLSPKTDDWLKEFRTRCSAEALENYLVQASKQKPMVIGEAIIDEYLFCDPLGKSSKDPILAFHYESTERYAGGSLAVANHLAGFCEEVGLITILGDMEREEDFIRQALHPNVRPYFLTRKSSPTIHKRRFVDTHTNARLFEIYVMEDTPLDGNDEKALLDCIQETVSGYDLVVTTDYGHGMMTPQAVSAVCAESKFLAVNTQANAGNRGFNSISRYPKVDYVCLAGVEVSLETRMRHAPQQELLGEIASRINCPSFAMTLGKDGSMHYEVGGGFTQVPALATSVSDRVGAGDAFLAITSLMMAQKAPLDIVGFVGNLAGAEMVADLGNRVQISRKSLGRHATALLK